MRIKLARTAGFCMGVRRAVEMALDLQRQRLTDKTVTYGPLIHNPQALELLESRGIKQVSSPDEIEGGTAVIRAHGITPAEMQALKDKGVTIIDATCPRVSRVQAVISKHAAKGYFAVIVGDEDHPEVRGLLGFASAGGLAVSSLADENALSGIPSDRPLCVVAQTTQEEKIFNEIVEYLEARNKEIRAHNTICDSTRRRQDEVRRIAGSSDLIVVVGGKGSGNTQRLARVAEAAGVPALHVETADEIDAGSLKGAATIGVTAGASTPNWQIQHVVDRLKEIDRHRARGPLKRLRRLLDVSVMMYVWAALGGGGLTAACMLLQRRQVDWLPIAVVVLFVFSMHLLNRLMDRSGAVRFNSPEIAAFYSAHKVSLYMLGAGSSAAALVLSYRLGAASFVVLACVIGAGILYSAPIIIWAGGAPAPWRSLKDVPGSKTPLVALGWATAATVVPVAGSDEPLALSALAVTFVFAAGIIFWRTAHSDLLDIQGDRIVGRGTIPIMLGVKRTGRLLKRILVFLGILLIAATAFGIVGGVGWILLVHVIFFRILFGLYEKRQLVDRLWFDALLDGNLFLAGVSSMLYGIL